jgi:hypothetical protein
MFRERERIKGIPFHSTNEFGTFFCLNVLREEEEGNEKRSEVSQHQTLFPFHS